MGVRGSEPSPLVSLAAPPFRTGAKIMEEQMKKLLGGLGLLTLMAFSVFTGPSQAATATKKIVTPMYQYDAAKEVTLKGTISSVVKKPAGGMLVGEHLMLATSSG